VKTLRNSYSEKNAPSKRAIRGDRHGGRGQVTLEKSEMQLGYAFSRSLAEQPTVVERKLHQSAMQSVSARRGQEHDLPIALLASCLPKGRRRQAYG
jgi:hypothetical protein